MNKDFVPFELAKKLKDKGFNKPCVAYYIPDCSKLYFNTAILLKKSTVENCLHSNNTTPIGYICSTFIDAPIIPQVLKWLREEKEIMVFPVYSTNTSKWYCVAINADSLEQYKLSLSDSYEEAALAGIEYVIDNLI